MPFTAARARREARNFANSVVPGRTYYSVVNLNSGSHAPWRPKQALMVWTFKKERWTGIMRHGSVGAETAWLSFGPLHEHRPAGLKTFDELRNLPQIPPDPAMALDILDAEPAGV